MTVAHRALTAKVAAASGKSEPGARLAKATRMRSDSPRSDADRMASNWNLRGAQDDSFWLDFDDGFVFPFGDAHLEGVEVLACGKIWRTPFDTNAVAELSAPLGIVAGQSRFSYEHTPSNTYLFAWADCAPVGGGAGPVSASIELFRNGDVRTVFGGEETFVSRTLPFQCDGIGQNPEWVECNIDDEEAGRIGYREWVDWRVGRGCTNGLYKLTVTFAETPPETVLLQIGEMSVAVAEAGDYVFLLKKGARFDGRVTPAVGGVTLAATDDLDAPPQAPRPQGGGGEAAEPLCVSSGGCANWTVSGGWCEYGYDPASGGIVMFWMPRLRGSPNIPYSHIGPNTPLPRLEAVLEDYDESANTYAKSPAFSWSGDNVEFSSPNAPETDATILSMPSWAPFQLEVSAYVCGQRLTSELQGATYGIHDEPSGVCGISLPPYLIRRDLWMEGSEAGTLIAVLELDTPMKGRFRSWFESGADKVDLNDLPTKDLGVDDVDEPEAGFIYIAPINGIAASDFEGDVAICFEFVDENGRQVVFERATTTVIAPTRVSVPEAPETGLAVLVGAHVGVSLDLGVENVSGVTTEWYTARRFSRNEYDPWQMRCRGSQNETLTMGQPGIFALKARTVCGCQSNEVEYVHRKDEPYIHAMYERRGPCKAGDRDHIGVASTPLMLNIRNHALARIGPSEYGAQSYLPARNGFAAVKKGVWKCNTFVADMAIEAGAPVPAFHRTGFLWLNKIPPLAADWKSDSVVIPGWTHYGTDSYPEPGCICSQLGHCGIVDYDGWTISARDGGVGREAPSMLNPTHTYNKPTGEN